MKVTIREYFDRADIKDAIEKMVEKGICDFKAYDIVSFDAGGPCWIETKKYVVKGGVVVSEKDIDVTPAEWPPYEQNGSGILVEVKLKVKFTSDDEWVREEFKKYVEKHISLSDYPETYTHISESESAYADEDGVDGICYRWIAGVKFRRKGRKVIVSRYDYSVPL